jgi:single-strand DNA-binding protein
VELDVDEIGASLKYATAKITKTTRSGGGGGGGDTSGQAGNDPWATQPSGAQSSSGNDPWASPAAGSEDPPF